MLSFISALTPCRRVMWAGAGRGTSAGFHLDVFDFEGHQKLAEEARDQGRTLGFQPSVVNASLDPIFNFARRRQVCQAEELLAETEQEIVKTERVQQLHLG
jgi:hypothetical protein